jgi:hypothetical protein
MQKWNSPVRLYFILILIQVIHSLEEIAARLYIWLPRVTGCLREIFDFVPQISFTRELFIAANVVVVLIMLAIGAFMLEKRHWAWRTGFAIGIIEVVNGVAHLLEAAATRGYFPGSISAIGLIIVAVLFLRSYSHTAPAP